MSQPGSTGTSATIDLGGPVHYVDFGGDPTGTPVVLVHGLGGSHLNWDLLAPLLTGTGQVRALDLPGFGRSEPGGRKAGVRDNVVVLDRFLTEVVQRPAVLIGNSMGGMISIFATAGRPAAVRELVLLDPAVPGPRRSMDPLVTLMFALYSLPVLGDRFLALRRRRSTPLQQVQETLRLCGVDPASLPPALIERSVAAIGDRQDVAGMDRAFLTAARSIVRTLVDPRRYRSAMDEIRVPVMLVQGDADRLVPVEAGRDVARRHPSWRYLELAGVGHVPMLQVPERLAGEITAWLAEVDDAVSGPAARS
jgi:pimeloyl-ACP methyl ester carboxylesterase